ncbi:hypothetical protein BD324DRAFT_619074 [Kockovaella imperatae]|uniref:Uncharacterized protein n=1 Tax=Kockovaella imperatae TaxID=4999 RepID=A0A1Y1UQ47_9TREE|nr:hypothetical protein BD324DRAFT_619074 [Kockovaella imperatae]ORX39265.1 hypothetical protein BD324DRAFT_619074 [Kockovaella imperatae]
MNPTLASMSAEELRRHQQSSTWFAPDTEFHGPNVGVYSMPNSRQTHRARIIEPQVVNGNQPGLTIPPTADPGVAPNVIEPSHSTDKSTFSEVSLGARIRQMLQTLPHNDPGQVTVFTELVKLRTKELELEIANARRKEKEAELELARFRSVTGSTAGPTPLEARLPAPTVAEPGHPTFVSGSYPFVNHARPLEEDTVAPIPDVQFDVDSLLQEFHLDNFLAMLPGSQEPSLQTMDPTQMVFPAVQPPPVQSSPIKRRFSSPAGSDNQDEPSKRPKKSARKAIIEDSTTCSVCFKPILRAILRTSVSDVPNPITFLLKCATCQPIASADSTDKTGLVTLDIRKRFRVSLEVDDEEHKAIDRRVFCDVCQRSIATGQMTRDGESMLGMLEIVCASCDAKYQRCTDCGGGGGSRIGIGKWRMKQVFQPGRKTCSLSHNRVGDRHREIGVHVTPTDFTPELLKEVLNRCQSMWNEKTLARLAVPEMLEIDLPPGVVNPLQSYSDVEAVIARNWPSREAMIRAQGADEKRFKRVLSLIWAHAKPRRSVKTVDLEEEYAKEDRSDHSTVLANVTHTDVVIPPGSDLIGMWGGEWDMEQGSLLISTLVPFEGADGEDSTALSVGEMITKVQYLRNKMNDEGQKLPQCEHLWVVSGGTMPLVRERVADVLIKKRSFVPIEEYLTRHPEFIHAVNARPRGLHPDLNRPDRGDDPKPLIVARWLGRDFDAERVLKIKQQEFGAKKAKKKKA